MGVAFRTNALRDCYRKEKEAIRTWGAKIGKLYRNRVNTLYAAADHRTLSAIAHLRFHPLKGGREGQYSIDLEKKAWRLIVTFQNDQFTAVRMEEVTDHYGD